MTFTEKELRAWAAQIVQGELAAVPFLERLLILGHIHGIEVSLEHVSYKTDRKRLQNLLEDARKAVE